MKRGRPTEIQRLIRVAVDQEIERLAKRTGSITKAFALVRAKARRAR